LVAWVFFFFFFWFLLLLPQVRANIRRRRGARVGKATGQNHMFWMWTQWPSLGRMKGWMMGRMDGKDDRTPPQADKTKDII
jgi:hypothetical protein